MARSELNSLLDKAKDLGDGDGENEGRGGDDGLREFSEEELQAELQRRSRERAAEQAAAAAQKTASASRDAGAHRTTTSARSGAQSASGNRRTAGAAEKPARVGDHELRKAYAALEVPFGADFDAVKKSYRTLMRKYHPDRHTGSPEKQGAAHDLAQRLTLAYTTVKNHHERR